MKRQVHCIQHAIHCAHKRGKRVDCGSGTALGILLVVTVCSMLVFLAVLGHVLSAKHQAHEIATAAALSGASVLQRMETHACEAASRTVTASKATVQSCSETRDEVAVRVEVALNIPFAKSVSAAARAGLEACEK